MKRILAGVGLAIVLVAVAVIAAPAKTIPSNCAFTAADGGTARSCASKLGDVVSVKDYGAVGDGVTDDATAINNAVAAATAAGGGTVRLPPGTFVVGASVNLPTTAPVTLQGDGPTTVLKLKASANVDVVTQANFSSLTGGASTEGVFRVGVRDLKIDGNKANNASGYGIRLFGRAFKIAHVTIHDAKNDCLWTEGNQGSFTDQTADLEPRLDGLTLIQCGGAGWTHKGPNDLVAAGIVSWGHGTWGYDWYKPFHFTSINTFLNTSGGCRVSSGGSANGSDAECTNAAGWGLLVDTGAGVSAFAASTAACNGCIGIEFKAAHQNFHGVVANSTTGVKFNGGGGKLDLVMFSNTTWFDCTSESGNVAINVYSNDNSGTMKGTSCWTGSEALRVPLYASNTTSFQIPGTLTGFCIAGWCPGFPGSNATLVVPDLAQTFTAAQRFTSTTNNGTCTLDGASPAKCTATVTSGARCVANPTGTTAAAATHTLATSVTTTTLTVTGANGLTDVVTYHCF